MLPREMEEEDGDELALCFLRESMDYVSVVCTHSTIAN